MLYNNLSEYFRQKYGQRIKKICIDGGFSCPNRDGKCGTGGCIYCGERGAGEHITARISIREQVLATLANSKPTDKFVAYFQNFSNTYASVEVLKERYDEALIDERIVALAVGTRPDCIDEDKVRLIAEYQKKVDVWVELGLQTSNDKTAEVINRGYPRSVFEKAVELLKKYSIPTVVHMIIGLPGEDKTDATATAKYISSLDVWGVKIHSIYVMKNTSLAEMYEKNLYTPPTLSEFCEICAECVGNISKSMTVHRLTGDCPRDLLLAPEWNKNKNEILDGVRKEMETRSISQGSLLHSIEQ